MTAAMRQMEESRWGKEGADTSSRRREGEDGGRGTRVSRWRTQVDQTDRKAGSRDGRQRRRAGEDLEAGKPGRWRRGADIELKLHQD